MPDEKVKYTILRDSQRRPTVTICEIRVNGSIGRGVAIRSINDNPVESIGKIKAHGRAIKALVRKENSLIVRSDNALRSIATLETFDGYRDTWLSFFKSIPGFKSQYIEAP